jgi:hypothetical protein
MNMNIYIYTYIYIYVYIGEIRGEGERGASCYDKGQGNRDFYA